MTAFSRAVQADAVAESDFARPYAPSWVDVLISWIDRLPGPPVLFYAIFGVVAVLYVNLEGWLGGWSKPGSLDPVQSAYAFYLVFPLALIHYLDRAAERAWRAFRPALDVDEAEAHGLHYQLTTVPARPAAALAIAGVSLNLVAYAADPVGTQFGSGYGVEGLVLRAIAESFLSAVFLVFLYDLLRQLRLVSRLLGRATRVDLFRPGPVYAFSQLTVRAGIGIVVIGAWQLLTAPAEVNFTATGIGWLAMLVLAGSAAFVLPLRGIHARIAAEKDRLETAASERLEASLERLHVAVDADDLTRADNLNKTLASLLQERDLLARIPTWPWRTGTLAAFASAILLPIGLWLVTRLLERLV